VEPNSALGGAILYLLKHWEKLTLFLRVPGAPLDNNICEQALKKAIRHRRNSLFYKTRHGAHAGELSANPQNWMPWNYRATLAGPSGTAH
jgi:transposase